MSSMSEAGRKSGGAGMAENNGAGAEREVAEWEQIGERAKSAAHSLLTVSREKGDRFLLTTSVVFMIHCDMALVKICLISF